MGFMTIDGRKVEFTDEKQSAYTVLSFRSIHLRCLSLVYRRG